MAAYDGPAEVIGSSGAPLESVRVELWCMAGGADSVWGGDLHPLTDRFLSGLEKLRGEVITLRLPTGTSAKCQVERVRQGAPQLVRVEGISAPPFM